MDCAAVEMVESMFSVLRKMVMDRDSEMDELLDEQAETKFKSGLDVKKKF